MMQIDKNRIFNFLTDLEHVNEDCQEIAQELVELADKNGKLRPCNLRISNHYSNLSILITFLELTGKTPIEIREMEDFKHIIFFEA